jgi:hypothetical protein
MGGGESDGVGGEESDGVGAWGGGRVAWGGGLLTDRSERCEVRSTGVSRLDKPLFVHIMCVHFPFLVRFSQFFLFPPVFLSYTVQAQYPDFRVYPSGLHKCPFCT